MTRMHPSGIFLTSDDGGKLVGLKHPDGSESKLSLPKTLTNNYYKTQPGQTVIDVSAVGAAGFQVLGLPTYTKEDVAAPAWFGSGNCVRFTNQSGSGATLNARRTLSAAIAALGSAPSMLVPVHITDFTKINTIPIRVSMNDAAFSTAFFSYTYSVGPGAAAWSKRNGWHLISIGANDWIANGTADWTTQTVNAVQISFLNASGQDGAQITLDKVIINQKAKAQILLMFDGVYLSQYTFIRPLLKALGLRATFSVTRGDLGQPGRMTVSQVKELIADGHAVVPRNLYTMNTKTADECVADVAAAQQYLRDTFGEAGEAGSRFLTYAQGIYYPSGGAVGDMSVVNRLSSELGIVGARTTDSTNSPGYLTLGADGMPPHIMTAPIIGSWNGNTEAQLKANVDTAIDRSSALIYFVHDSQHGSSFDSPELVRKFFEYVALKKSQYLISDTVWPEFFDGMTQS